MPGGATQYVNRHDNMNLRGSEKCRDFSAEVVRATVLDGAVRAFDLLTGVSASSTAAAVRDRVERLQRLRLRVHRRGRERGDDVGMEATVGLDFGSMRMSPG
jgi:hypothetical protein